MNEDSLNVIILWHLHQPSYKDPKTNSFILPWVRLHATKNYLMMVEALKKHPDIHLTFNLTPCLIEQIEAYTLGESDSFLDLTMKPAEELTVEEKEELLWSCFLINWEKQIPRFPRYLELLSKRGRKTPRERLRERLRFFNESDFRDLQILFNLAWFNVMHIEDPDMKRIVEKGRDFDETDKTIIKEKLYRIIGEILPGYIGLERSGQIELSTTPYYHPIMPLLCDISIARVAVPTMSLPGCEFMQPDDAAAQMKQAIEKYQSLTGHPPSGIWPSEGSVSEEVFEILGEFGIRWAATDEEILARSKEITLFRNAESVISHPDVLYKPYLAGPRGNEVTLFFRDRYLSDHIGFVYSRWPARQAVSHFMDYLKTVYETVRGTVKAPVISIILDGENPWEYFDTDGTEFLDSLYEELENAPHLRTVTPTEYLNLEGGTDHIEKLDWVFPGSWINANFRIWIGHPEDNRAWELIEMTRRDLVEHMRITDAAVDADISQAWQELYMAEGSDWFWWYGDDHSSATDAVFDRLFRMHLMRVYELIGSRIPVELYRPISSATKRQTGIKNPRGKLTIHLDGIVTSFYEWYEAGCMEVDRIADARAIEEGSIESIYWGESSGNFVLRIDFREGVKPWPGLKLYLKLVSPIEANIPIYDGANEGIIVYGGKTIGQYVFRDILELYIECKTLDCEPGHEILFSILEKSPSGRMFQHPDTEMISLKPIPADDPDWIV